MLKRSGSVASGSTAGFALSLALLLALIGSPAPASADPGGSSALRTTVNDEVPTFYGQVELILRENCQVCHQSAEVTTGGLVAPMALETYEQSRPWAPLIAQAVVEGRMPPWSAHIQHQGTFEDERYLSEEEKATLVAWAEGGAPEGDRSLALPPPAQQAASGPVWILGNVELVVDFAEPVEIGDEVDDWQPTILAPVTKEQHPEPRWIKAAELQAGGPHVHHIVTSHLGVGTPGRGPFRFPEGWGILLPTEPVVTFNMHYYKTPGEGTAIEDSTRGGFQFYQPGEVIDHVVETDINGYGTSLFIPAGADNHMVTWERPFDEDVYLLSMGPHAHYRGKSFQYELELPDGSREVLLWIPDYDFNWQHLYQLKEPRFIPAGSILHATWWFDNSDGNEYNPDHTVDVFYGAETFNEMANARIYFAYAEKRGIVAGGEIPADVLERAERQEEQRREQLRRTGQVDDHN